MKPVKRVLAKLNAPYAVGALRLGGRQCVVAGTEDHGPILLAAAPYTQATAIVPGPGGCMALASDPQEPGELFAIMGCFPGYRFQTGAVHHIRQGPGGWASTKILDLPFAHRIDFVARAGRRFLIAAALARDKSDPNDWSQPGSLYACAVPSDRKGTWQPVPVLEGIHRNHGLLVAPLKGKRTVLVSGAEGLFALDLDKPGSAWDFSKIIDREISEVAVLDLDGDGRDELATIEPFHGDRLCVYRPDAGTWRLAWDTGLEFGHGLLAGMLGGVASVLVSNRAGSRDLLLFQFPRGLEAPERSVIDAGAGAANALILRDASGESIVSANQAAGEIALYEVKPP